MAPARRVNLLRSSKKSEDAMGEYSLQRVTKLKAKMNIRALSNTSSSQHTSAKRTRKRHGGDNDSCVGVPDELQPLKLEVDENRLPGNFEDDLSSDEGIRVLDEIQPIKLGVDENMLLDNLAIDLSSDEDVQNAVAVKTEIKLEEHDTSIREHHTVVQEEDDLESLEVDTSIPIRNYSRNSPTVDGSSGSHTVEPTRASIGGSDADDITRAIEKILKTYCKTNIKCQNMLFALTYTLHPQDTATLQDIITSGKELASAVRLMANTVQILAVAERMKSKAAIIRARIELAKAKREGIEIK